MSVDGRLAIAGRVADCLLAVHGGQELDVVAIRLRLTADRADALAGTGLDDDRRPLDVQVADDVRRHPPHHRPPVVWPARVESRVEQLATRARVLTAAGVDVETAGRQVGLDTIDPTCRADLDRWEAFLLELEVEWFDAGRPFPPAAAERAAA